MLVFDRMNPTQPSPKVVEEPRLLIVLVGTHVHVRRSLQFRNGMRNEGKRIRRFFKYIPIFIIAAVTAGVGVAVVGPLFRGR